MAIIDIKMPPTHTDEGLVAAEEIRVEHALALGDPPDRICQDGDAQAGSCR